MKIRIVALGTVAFCVVLLQCQAFAQIFPKEPAARLGKGAIWRIAYSPDGKLLAAPGGLGIWLYDAENLNEVGLLDGPIG